MERNEKRYIYIVYTAGEDGYEEVAAFGSEERAREFIEALGVDMVYWISQRES